MRLKSMLNTLLTLLVFVGLIVAVWVIEQAKEQPADEPPQPASSITPAAEVPSSETYDFDFWILSLSWSPDYCATDGQDDAQQCGIGRKLGFVLHGLWPQYNRGYPSYCSNEKLPAGLAGSYPGLYPSSKLYSYEWEKHGTCSGLTPEGYLDASARVKASIVIPEVYRAMPQPLRTTPRDVKTNFVKANQGMREWSLAVFCSGSGRYLTEVWVCVGLDEALTSCSSEIRSRETSSCQSNSMIMRNMR